MKRFIVMSIFLCLFVVGCDSLRFAPSEEQKQNAWLHNRTTAMTRPKPLKIYCLKVVWL